MAKQIALWKYFTTKEPTKEEAVEAILPKPNELFLTSMPSSAMDDIRNDVFWRFWDVTKQNGRASVARDFSTPNTISKYNNGHFSMTHVQDHEISQYSN